MADEEKKLCFVIGPIGEAGGVERKHADMLMNMIIKDVLDREGSSYRVKRADEDADPGMITNRIIIDITQAELVVADLTDLNPNVFYELGIRHAALKPTIHIARAGTKLPFDNAGYRTIMVDLQHWQSVVDARAQLADMVRHIASKDYHPSNPITQAKASFTLKSSGDPRDTLIAQLQDRLSAVEMVTQGVRSRSMRSVRWSVPPLIAAAFDRLTQAVVAGRASDIVTAYRDSFPMTGDDLQLLRFAHSAAGRDWDGAAAAHAILQGITHSEARQFIDTISQWPMPPASTS